MRNVNFTNICFFTKSLYCKIKFVTFNFKICISKNTLFSKENYRFYYCMKIQFFLFLINSICLNLRFTDNIKIVKKICKKHISLRTKIIV